MNLHTTRTIRDQYLSQGTELYPGTFNLLTLSSTDMLCRDCNTLEDALADSQTAVKLLQDQVAQLKAERVDLMKEVEELKAWKNGEHVRNFREMVDAQKDRDAAIARAEKAERGFKNLRDGSGWQDEHDRAEKLAGLLRNAPRLVVNGGGEVWLHIKDAAINLGSNGRGPIVKNKLFKAVEQSKAIDAALAECGESGE